ncbi:MAG TPA: glycosyltransferase family 2 protein [Bacteroidales bacterium]|jgi:glycosyltransferase involved in cell wall biosynthesis|nr:glycosyltransferase family 2 protein [Bacteroidales bacterium]HOS73272.1 glycosyltransferase family 2 protein [Bacteroidales bacterium]HQH25627.1 glycosyltransferase family 2 protein [Bacteroidales bacterium]HQJ82820.1 glycosyltransferase family 2 protein [Bacteroidales bacterium]
MTKISGVIISYNEEKHIGKCLASLQGIADEIIVVDSFSDDSTRDVCSRFNVRFIEQAFKGYVEQKNSALGFAGNRYVLSLDADEELSEELRESILKIKDNPEYDGYQFNRLTNYCGKWMKYSGWYPDRHIRLFDTEKGRWAGTNPHDKIRMNTGSRVTRLRGDILHWYCETFEEHMDKSNHFSSIMAEEYFRQGKKSGILSASFHKWWRFIRTYFIGAGFLDGFRGHAACSISAQASYLKYIKLLQLNRDAKKTNSGHF